MNNNTKFNKRQKKIRDIEWYSVAPFLTNYKGKFLDIGAGTGYAMFKAEQLGFEVYGIEPSLNVYGVNDEDLNSIQGKITHGYAESLSFQNDCFQIAYASHSLEHFNNMENGLSEISRVLEKSGMAIICVPTATMIGIGIISEYLFRTHRRIAKFIIKERSFKNFINIFLPSAHGSQNSTLFGELITFKVKNWKKLVSKYFEIKETLYPCLYPYPDFPQIFPYRKFKSISSSVIFICYKK